MPPTRFTRSPMLSEPLPAWRIRLLLRVLLAGFALLAAYSFYLQSFDYAFLQKKGESRYERLIETPAVRGRILDRHGEPLAVSTPVESIWTIPDSSQFSPRQLRQLAAALDMSVADLSARLTSDRDFIYLRRQLAPDEAQKVMALNLPGINQQRAYHRYYPSGEVTAQVLGFTGDGDAGQEGIELAFNRILAGQNGSRRVIKDRRGNVVEDVAALKQPQDGSDVTLSLDAKIQYLAYASLKEAVRAHRARAGAAVVLDVETGEVLALANWPTYNPNNRNRMVGPQVRNRVFTDTFEPGSTLKTFAAALALESGQYHPNTRIETGNGKLTIGTATISDTHAHGTISLTEVLKYSSNVGITRVALNLPAQSMWNNFENLGFGAPVKLGFPGEVAGHVRPWKSWKPIEQATMSYGNGISVTLIQLAHAYLSIARDGDLIPLSLLKLDAAPAAYRRVYSAATASSVRAMLETVVEPGGTATRAHVPGYRIAGKSGTARKVENGAYAPGKYVSSFIGMAPASAPRLIVAVMVDEPSDGKIFGGDVAAPAFAQIMGGALRTLGIAADAGGRVRNANIPDAPDEF